MSNIQELITKVGAGVSPKISGSPLAAYLAQLNRFREHAQVPLLDTNQATLSMDAALNGITLLQARLISGLITLPEPSVQTQLAELDAGLKDPIGYIAPRLAQTTQILAIYGDMIKLPSAKIGITVNSVKRGWGTVIGLAAVLVFGIGGVVIHRYHQRALPAAE